VALVRTDVSEKRIASIIKVKRISKLRTTLGVTATAVPNMLILFILVMEAILFSETSVLIRATRRLIPEDDILQAM
jgi:hypothetical protein